MHKLESEFKVSPNYMKERTIITEKMRSNLVDWLVQIHLEFRLLEETLFTTISILDRFLSVYDVTEVNLQLAGVSAMLLASKYEEMYAPEIGDFVYITDNYSCVKFLPSEISAASLNIAIKATSNSENDECSATKWTKSLQYYCMYSETKLLPCAKHIAFLITKTLDGSAKLQAVNNKYASRKFKKVSQNPYLKSSFIKQLAPETSN